jgi:arylformamidase
MKIIDISVPASEKTAVYPGDPKPRIHWPSWTHAKGNPANVGAYTGGLHFGTHVDAPWHFIPGGKKMQEIPLETWIGPAEVVDLTACEDCITAGDLDAANLPADAKRLLFKTRNGQSDYWYESWNPNFIYIDETAATWCNEQGILLVGLDYLTVDPPSRPAFPAHLELLGNGIVILENIVLRDVAAGRYTLHAAPVNLQDVDGAWCRAYLTRE